MIDNDEEYRSLKKLCDNKIYQFTAPAPWDKNKTVGCPHWVFSEEYALTHDKFELYWHTPGVMDGGVYCEAKFNPLYDKNTLVVELHQDGFIDMGVIQHAEIPMQRCRNRMLCLSIDEERNDIQLSWFEDPDYTLWTVQYINKSEEEQFVTVRAHSKNEAKVVAWGDSCYRDEPINPEAFKAYPYNPKILTMGQSKTYLAVLLSQIDICNKYDEEDEATRPDSEETK